MYENTRSLAVVKLQEIAVVLG